MSLFVKNLFVLCLLAYLTMQMPLTGTPLRLETTKF